MMDSEILKKSLRQLPLFAERITSGLTEDGDFYWDSQFERWEPLAVFGRDVAEYVAVVRYRVPTRIGPLPVVGDFR